MTNSSIETIAQLNALRTNYQYVILTDGAVDQYLGPQIKAIQGVGKLSNLYMSFPTPCAMPKALADYLKRDTTLKMADFEMTHSLFVADASYIILSMLANGLRADSGKKGNDIIAGAITKVKDQARQREDDKSKANPESPIVEPIGHPVECNLPFPEGGKREYEIDKFGNAVNSRYSLYSIEVVPGAQNNELRWRQTTGDAGAQCVDESPPPATTKSSRASRR